MSWDEASDERARPLPANWLCRRRSPGERTSRRALAARRSRRPGLGSCSRWDRKCRSSSRPCWFARLVAKAEGPRPYLAARRQAPTRRGEERGQRSPLRGASSSVADRVIVLDRDGERRGCSTGSSRAIRRFAGRSCATCSTSRPRRGSASARGSSRKVGSPSSSGTRAKTGSGRPGVGLLRPGRCCCSSPSGCRRAIPPHADRWSVSSIASSRPTGK